MVLHNKHKIVGPYKQGWDDLKNEYSLDIESERASGIHNLGNRLHVMRIGSLCENSPTTFNAKHQAKSYFESGWKPKRLRVTRQANDFLSKTSFDLTIFMAKQQKELDEKEREERKEEGEYDGDDDDSFPLATSDHEREDDESFPYETPAKSQPVVFDMKHAKAEPIVWKSPNGTTQTAVRIPCAAGQQ
jgi:hypothetical protein